jgi:membrane protein YqaA with SNARE-associated domain
MVIKTRQENTNKPPIKNTTNNWFVGMIQSGFSAWGLAIISFLESALPLPLITDPFLIAAILVDRTKALKFVLIATTASVFGGLVAYYLAYFAFDLLNQLMSAEIMGEVNDLVETNTTSTLVLTLLGAVTPVPYTVVAWVVAALKGNPLIFIIGSILGRGGRYLIVGYCSYKFGPLAISYAKRYIALTSVLLIIVVIFLIWLKM